MHTGVIKFFNSERGFGFIVPDAGGQDVFVHIRHIGRDILPEEGLRVCFDLVEDGRTMKSRADNVRLA